VVHLHKLYPQLSAAPAVIAASRRIPVVQTLHDYELLTGSPLDDGGLAPTQALSVSDRLMAALMRVVAATLHRPAVDAWVAGSDYVAGACARRGVRARVLPMPTAAPTGPPSAFKERRGAVFAGRLVHHKGALDLVEL